LIIDELFPRQTLAFNLRSNLSQFLRCGALPNF